MNDRLRKLYQEVILRHQRAPFHYYPLREAPIQVEAYNPLCGDQYTLYMEADQEQILQASFSGYGCAISQASTSMLVELLHGNTLKEASELVHAFEPYVFGEGNLPDLTFPTDWEALQAVRQFPARRRCVSLCWATIKPLL